MNSIGEIIMSSNTGFVEASLSLLASVTDSVLTIVSITDLSTCIFS